MFCPNCNGFITESSLIKSRVKKFENADIEYEARCPLCSVKIGVMFWGKLNVAQELQHKIARQYRAEQVSYGGQQEPGAIAAQPTPQPEEKPYMDPPPSGNLLDPFDDDSSEDANAPDFSSYQQSYTDQQDLSSIAESLYAPDQLSGHYCPYCGGDLPNDVNFLPRRYRPK